MKKFFFALLAILLIGSSVYAYQTLRKDEATPPQDDSGIKYDPPTEEEQRAGDEIKKDIVQDREETSDDNGGSQETDSNKKSATVIITDASQYDNIIEVRAFVSDHIQDGTCSYRFTRNSDSVEKSLPAHADASTTICPALEVPRSEFSSAGEWQLIVSYESSEAQGSQGQTVTIN